MVYEIKLIECEFSQFNIFYKRQMYDDYFTVFFTQYSNFKLILIQKINITMENEIYNMNSSSVQESDSRGSRLKRKPMFDDRGNLQNGVRLSFEKGFGFNQDAGIASAHCIDDNKIIYILGKQIVLYDMLSENQKVMDNFGQEQEITCFKYFKNMMLDDNILYALYAANKIYPTLMIKNFSKGHGQKYIMSHLQKEEKVVFLDLVNDYKFICVLSELLGNYRISLIQISSKQVYCSQGIYFQLKGIIVPFSNDKIIILYSENQFYVIAIGLEVKPISLKFSTILKEQDETIVEAITSMQNDLDLYVITNRGNLYYLTVNLHKHQISHYKREFLGNYETVDDQNNLVQTIKIPSSICCNEYNILIGYHYVEQFTLVKICALNTANSIEAIRFSCPFLHKITKMTFAQETMAVCVIVQVKENDKYDLSIPIQSDYLKQKGQIKTVKQNPQSHKLPPGKVFPVIFNLLLHDTLVETLRSPIQSVLTSTLLTQKILDICLIPTKKLFLILSAERRIKAIKYEHISSTSFERMLAWECSFNPNDNPTSLDVHPLTFNVAVAFKEGLKLFVISAEGLRTTNIQFPLKNCESVRYSKYGQKLVAGSLNQLIVINPYNNKVINTIQLNSGYMVRQLAFLSKDMFLHGMFANGSSMIMNSEGVKLFEVWNKNSKSICSAFDSVFDIMAVSYTESITKFYRDRGSQQFAVMWTYPFNITKLLIVNEVGTIFMGTSLGRIRAHQWPFTDSMKFSKFFTEIQLHAAAVTELKVTHDYGLLISGAEDGSIFISKINAVSDGISVNDAQLLSSFKTSYKNYKSLYYMQNYLNTSTTIENDQQETIGQLESDKSDFETEYCDTIANIQVNIDGKVKQEEERRAKDLKDQIGPLQKSIDKLNENKMIIREELVKLMKQKTDQSMSLQEQKLTRMRSLYKETDALNEKKQFYIDLYRGEVEEMTSKQKLQIDALLADCRGKEEKLASECGQIEKQYNHSKVSYRELMNEQTQQGQIYKGRMIAEMGRELQVAKEAGELLRKRYNKLYHDNNNYQEKMKYFQQLMTELEIDIENAINKGSILKTEEKQLQKMLLDKDKHILNEERQVKELLTGNISCYTHEEYLRLKKEELLGKEKYLEGEISQLDKKYCTFQQNFTLTCKQSKDLDGKIKSACETISRLKNVQRQKKQVAYLRRYKQKEVEKNLSQIYHRSELEANSIKDTLSSFVDAIDIVTMEDVNMEAPVEVAVGQRDHLIKQVTNANNLRRIDDTIGRTIMIKLNRETVSLTWEVNELRKEKKILSIKANEIEANIKELKQADLFKENSSVQDIVPANISIIRGHTSKHHSSHKLLPFQTYHNNKSIKISTHSKQFAKDLDQSSTMLPSIMKHNASSSIETSALCGVEETDDEILTM